MENRSKQDCDEALAALRARIVELEGRLHYDYSEERYKNIVESLEEIGEGIFIVDSNKRVRYMNKVMVNWFGDHTGEICYSSIAKRQSLCSYCKLDDVIGLGEKVHYRPTTPDGRTFNIVAVPLHNSDGTVSKMEVILDITEQIRIEEELRDSEERYRSLVESSSNCIFHLDLDGKIIYANPVGKRFLGDSLEKTDLVQIIKSEYRGVFEGGMEKARNGETAGIEYSSQASNGPIKWWVANITPVKDADARVISILMSAQDITKRKLAEDMLAKLASTDKLTNTYNRTKFDELIGREMNFARRHNHFLSLILFDLDNFKNVNDTFGHMTGDTVLKDSAEIVKGAIRDTDFLVRWGGEEFMIIAPVTAADGAKTLAQRIRSRFEGHEFGNGIKMTASFGIAEFKRDESENSFIKRADRALYIAKMNGKNRIENAC
ncbi:MAG: diguanylate cyclase [Deltaproteobacteria bacterium]|nr:diguanylate cyclase [Deltaproteobacteria bacterium]